MKRLALGLLIAAAVAACGSGAAPSGVATNPPFIGGGATTPSGDQQSGDVRTVLSPLGLNVHSDSNLQSAHVGTAAQGALFEVLAHTDQNGGWYQVKGATVTGWITADPSLSAPGRFVLYQSAQRGFTALYPQDWTFAEEQQDVLFRPQSGPDTVVVRSAQDTAHLGPAGADGYVPAGSETVEVCGTTGTLLEYTRSAGSTATPVPGTAGRLNRLAQIQLTLDSSHAMGLDFNYTDAKDLQHFRDFFDSVAFPFPQCEQVATASPSPT